MVAKFLHRDDLDLICRAHRVVKNGYDFFTKSQLVSLFSVANYCGEFENAGAMMRGDSTLNMLFLDFKACRGKEAKCHRTHNTSKGYDHKASKEIDVILTLPGWDL